MVQINIKFLTFKITYFYFVSLCNFIVQPTLRHLRYRESVSDYTLRIYFVVLPQTKTMANVNIKRNTKRILVFTINKDNYAFLIVEKKKKM